MLSATNCWLWLWASNNDQVYLQALAIMDVLCSIYRSSKKEGMYLYVDKRVGMERVPASLLKRFGKPQPAMTLLLNPGKKLARVDVVQVLAALDEPGYFLQMPPQLDRAMSQLRAQNTKL